MSQHPATLLHEVSRHFLISGDLLHAEPCKIGHINETYTATYSQGGTRVRYIHQKINAHVFKKPLEVMDNVVRVTEHLRRRLTDEGAADLTRRALIVVPTREGSSVYRDTEGEYWRTFVFVEGAETFEASRTPKQAFEAGHAFGRFQHLLVDMPGPRLHDTIPFFHHSRRRFDALRRSIESDACNRAAGAWAEIDFAARHEPLVDVLLQAQARGEIPERITHNDTKFNNVMLDQKTGAALCVVDLDTVMPGLVHYDFGDMVRTTTSPTVEDELDLAKVRMRMPMFEALARGYLSAAGAFLTPAETALLAFSGKLVSFTIGLRFLTDHLEGDRYFRVHRPGHNLDRCRTQFKLVESIAAQEEAMQGFVERVARGDGVGKPARKRCSATPSPTRSRKG